MEFIQIIGIFSTFLAVLLVRSSGFPELAKTSLPFLIAVHCWIYSTSDMQLISVALLPLNILVLNQRFIYIATYVLATTVLYVPFSSDHPIQQTLLYLLSTTVLSLICFLCKTLQVVTSPTCNSLSTPVMSSYTTKSIESKLLTFYMYEVMEECVPTFAAHFFQRRELSTPLPEVTPLHVYEQLLSSQNIAFLAGIYQETNITQKLHISELEPFFKSFEEFLNPILQEIPLEIKVTFESNENPTVKFLTLNKALIELYFQNAIMGCLKSKQTAQEPLQIYIKYGFATSEELKRIIECESESYKMLLKEKEMTHTIVSNLADSFDSSLSPAEEDIDNTPKHLEKYNSSYHFNGDKCTIYPCEQIHSRKQD